MAAAAYVKFNPETQGLSPWMPMIVGTLITNFLARWWSFSHPPRFSQEWEDRQLDGDEF